MIRKEVVLFGTGKYFNNYMRSHEGNFKPLFAVDNDVNKIGKKICGIEIKKPDILLELDKESFYIIICSAARREMAEQLEEMGIYDYQFYTPMPMETSNVYTLYKEQFILADEYLNMQGLKVKDGSKPYKIGYTPGTFDLFHIGHLNLLRNAKTRCEYLIVGVLTDQLYEYFKHKQPYIPFEQRIAIIESICYVDRVVQVDFKNTKKIDAWEKYHFDCHFSGNDHSVEWESDLEQLREVGSNMEFFEYTKANSSTAIKLRIDSNKG